MISKLKNTLIEKYCRYSASYQAKKIYPEAIDLDLGELLTKPREIRVTIIDDVPFPWIDAVESRGCKVSYFPDYTKSITQPNQKIKTISATSSDIIFCDINGIGSAIYPGLEGIGVIEELRRKHPLHVIVAYTGNPGAIHTKIKKKETLDRIFSRDWAIDDFLFNLDDLLKIFRSPKSRWEFIQARLRHLEVKEKDIDVIRSNFVENIILGKMLKHKFNSSTEQIERLMKSPNEISFSAIANAGLNAIEFTKFLSPLILGAVK